jgi:hypothetical protein
MAKAFIILIIKKYIKDSLLIIYSVVTENINITMVINIVVFGIIIKRKVTEAYILIMF